MYAASWRVRNEGALAAGREAEWKRKVRKQVRAIAVMGNIEGAREASCKSRVCRVG